VPCEAPQERSTGRRPLTPCKQLAPFRLGRHRGNTRGGAASCISVPESDQLLKVL